METQSRLEVFGSEIPVRRMNEMARQISTGITGSKPVNFAGFVWYRPQSLSRDTIPETQERAA